MIFKGISLREFSSVHSIGIINYMIHDSNQFQGNRIINRIDRIIQILWIIIDSENYIFLKEIKYSVESIFNLNLNLVKE